MARLPNFLVIIRSEKLSGKGQGRGVGVRKKERFVLGKRTFRSQKSKHFVLRIIVVSFDGESPRRLRKSIEGDLKRNTIYTVTIRKDDIDIVTRPVLDEWEQGYDTELVPL